MGSHAYQKGGTQIRHTPDNARDSAYEANLEAMRARGARRFRAAMFVSIFGAICLVLLFWRYAPALIRDFWLRCCA